MPAIPTQHKDPLYYLNKHTLESPIEHPGGSAGLGDASDGSIAGLLNAIYQVYTSNVTPDTEDTIVHGLGRIPVGFLVVDKDKAGDIYDGGTAWTDTNIYLKCSVATVAAVILVW